MNAGVENGDVNCGHCYMNSYTGSESKNHNSIHYKNKRDEIYPNIYEMKSTGLQDSVVIDVMLPVYILNQYASMEDKNENNNILRNGNIST